jgi:glutamine synthetase
MASKQIISRTKLFAFITLVYSVSISPLNNNQQNFHANSKNSHIFGSNVFGLETMKHYLSSDAFKSIKQSIETGQAVSPEIADSVASAMQHWALDKGATHYSHVFYPLTGSISQKYDGFFFPDGKGSAFTNFDGKALLMGETDGSSFPNGGARETSKARAYTLWDSTSPAYIVESENGAALCIPTMFASWKGDALDTKIPLLRSMQAVDKQANRVLKLLGHKDVDRVVTFAGSEQEYFLVEKKHLESRPDLKITGRTLFGANPEKGQDLDDHYFSTVLTRVINYMCECEHELFKLGIPAKTRHCEVAPMQFEIVPVFESANIAADHQQLIMKTLKTVATKHDFECLLHEKPFANLNGSGKHLNFSLGNSNQGNLFEPGENPNLNSTFLIFCGAVIRATHKYSELIRASVASAGNDHRLGGHEAPPAIISVFLGDELASIFEQIKLGNKPLATEKHFLTLGVSSLPKLYKDSGDRNRTSPMAFTGNKFEFRAVGSNQSISTPATVLNTALAEALEYIADNLERTLDEKTDAYSAALYTLQEIMLLHGSIIFEGNGYSSEWKEEAEHRGLANHANTVDAINSISSEKSIELFSSQQVLSPDEFNSRIEVEIEKYISNITIEAKLTLTMARTMILPAVYEYQTELSQAENSLKSIELKSNKDLLENILNLREQLEKEIRFLDELLENKITAEFAFNKIVPAMRILRATVDSLELLLPQNLWPMATYREMLTID